MGQDHTKAIEPNLFSKRALEFLKSPKLSSSDRIDSVGQAFQFWKCQVAGDKILTLTYHLPPDLQANALECFFHESIAQFAIGRSLQSLLPLSLRELESFLRDENHQEAFKFLDSPELCFIKVKNNLLGAILVHKISKHLDVHRLAGWENASYLQKNRLAKTLLDAVNLVIQPAHPMRLALVEGRAISVTELPNGISPEIVELLFQALLRDSSLKVVAV